MFRKEEAAVTDWSQETVALCARRQKEILHSGAMLVRPGGRLVYSTCTFAPEENEQTIQAFLQIHPEFSAQRVDAPWFTPAGKGMFRLWPHKLLGEGHFVAVLHKKDGETPDTELCKGEAIPEQWREFAEDLHIQLPEGKLISFGQRIYWAPVELPLIQGIKVLRPGLELGEIQKGRFEPAHALALWLQQAANTQDYSADSEHIQKYLHGDVVPSSRRGWCLITVDGYGIGWGKGDGKVLKNHYPKGLRR